MKKLIVVLLVLVGMVSQAQVENRIPQYTFIRNLGVGRSGANDSAAYLQIGPSVGGDKGMIIPRVANLSAITATKRKGLIVYDDSKDSIAFHNGTSWSYIGGGGGGGIATINVRRSIAKGSGDSLQLVNDITSSILGEKYRYGVDSTGNRAFEIDPYIIAKKHEELRGLRSGDTGRVYRFVSRGVIGDFYYDPNDNTSVDDSVMVIVSGTKRFKRFIPDGEVDVSWFGVKGDGSDETPAVKRAFRWFYNNRPNGGIIRMASDNVIEFDPTAIDIRTNTTIKIKGRIRLRNEWLLGSGVSIVGEGGGNGVVQFERGPKATIERISSFQDTSKAILHLVGGSAFFSNFNILYPVGKGIWIDGWSEASGGPVTAGKHFSFVSIIGADTSSSIPFLVEHALWTYFTDCAVVGLPKMKHSMVFRNRVNVMPPYKFDLAQTALVFIERINMAGKGILINSGVNTGQPIGNFHLNSLVFEFGVQPDAVIELDSRQGAVDYIYLRNILFADGNIPLIRNRGHQTYTVELAGINTTDSGVAATGDHIRNFRNTSDVQFDYRGFSQKNRVLREYQQVEGEVDALNANAGWRKGFFTNPRITPFPLALVTDTVTGRRAPDGSLTAYRAATESVIYSNSNADIDSGDYVFAGAWVRSERDTVLKYFGSSPLAVNLTNAIYSLNNVPFFTVSSRFGNYKDKGWVLVYGFDRIKSTSGTVGIDARIIPESDNPLLVWKPFVYVIKDSLFKQDEVLAWAKENIGYIEPKVPAGASGIIGTTPVYLGDSTRWNNTTKKWEQLTKIDYTESDSDAVATKGYVDNVAAVTETAVIANATTAPEIDTMLRYNPANPDFILIAGIAKDTGTCFKSVWTDSTYRYYIDTACLRARMNLGSGSGSGTLSNLNGQSGASQTFATGTSGTDFGISSSGNTHTFNLPTSSGTNRGLLSPTDWTTFNNKVGISRNLLAGWGMIGGGDLSADRTLRVDSLNVTSRARSQALIDSLAALVATSTIIRNAQAANSRDPFYFPALGQVVGKDITATQDFSLTGTDTTNNFALRNEEAIGTIYSKNSWPNLNDFNTNGTTPTVSSNKLSFSSGDNTTRTIDIKQFSKLDNWKISGKFQVKQRDANSTGFGVGWRSWIGLADAIGVFNSTNGINSGKVQLVLGGSVIATSSGAVSFAIDDYILVTTEMSKGVITVSARNVTTNAAPVSVSYEYIVETPSPPAGGRFAVSNVAGNFILDSLAVYSTEPKNALLAVLGDSKAKRAYNGKITDRYASILGEVYSNTIVHAGPGDRLEHTSASLTELISLAPKNVLMHFPSNDIRNSYDSTVIKNRYDSIVTALTSAGINVIHTTGHYESVINQVWMSNYIRRTYPTKLIETYDAGRVPGYLIYDNTHQSLDGHQIDARSIIESGKIPGGVYKNRAATASRGRMPTVVTDWDFTEEYLNATATGTTQSGGATSSYPTTTDGRLGVIQLSVSASGDGAAWRTRLISAFNSKTRYVAKITGVVFSHLARTSDSGATAGNRALAAFFGFHNSIGTSLPTDGAYMQYSDLDGSIQIVTASASARTIVNTAARVDVNLTYDLQIEVDADGAYYYINNELVGTIRTNIPRGAVTTYGAVAIGKSAGTSSTNITVDGCRFGHIIMQR